MKIIFCIITAFIFLSVNASAQIKKDTVAKAQKPQYEKFYKIAPEVYDFLMNSAHNYKDGLIYNNLLTTDQIVTIQLRTDNTLFYISKNIKLDSLIIKKDTTNKAKPK